MEFDVSIVIPAYNIEQYIHAALESVVRQNPPFKQIIVIDDGSTDGTGDVVRGFGDPRVLYHYQKNQGLGPARNTGISLAKSSFLYFMDGDDLLVEGMTREIGAMLCRPNSTPDAIFFSAIDFDDSSGRRLTSSNYFKWHREGMFASGRAALLSSLHKASVPACVFLCVFKRALLEEPRQLRFLNMLHEDEIFTPSLMLQSAGSVYISNEILYRRRVRAGSIMTTRASSRNVSGSLAVSTWWREQAEQCVEKDASRAFRAQADRFYGMAIVYAARAGLHATELAELVAMKAPCYLRWLSIDFGMASVSRRLAFWFIRLRLALVCRWNERSVFRAKASKNGP